jgi:serine/threonine-protein kinase
MLCPCCARDIEPVHGCCPYDGAAVAITARDQALLGQVVAGRWQLERVLGQGGFATVFYAVDHHMGAASAVKVLHSERSSDSDLVSRFENEIYILEGLHHPGIVGSLGGGEDPAVGWYIAMPLLPGRDLALHLAADGPLSPRAISTVGHDMLAALASLHRQGIVHRDVKSENVVLVGPPGQAEFERAVLIDFGVAKHLSQINVARQTGGLTRPRQVIGSAWTMAPEQVLADPVDGRTDLYSFGVLLFEMLTGELPFAAARVGLVMRAHVYEPPPPPSARSAGRWIPQSVDQLVLDLLAKEPHARPANAAEVWHRWRAALPEILQAWSQRTVATRSH